MGPKWFLYIQPSTLYHGLLTPIEGASRLRYGVQKALISCACYINILLLQADYGRDNLLSHPVTRTLFAYKWNAFGLAYYINIFTFGLFLIILTLYALLLESPISDTCKLRIWLLEIEQNDYFFVGISIRANNTSMDTIQCGMFNNSINTVTDCLESVGVKDYWMDSDLLQGFATIYITCTP